MGLEVGMPTAVSPFLGEQRTKNMIIGVDPHKSSHTATAVDAVRNTAVGSLQVDATLAGYWHLLRWARQFKDRRWAVDNARGLGCHLALVACCQGRDSVRRVDLSYRPCA